MDVSLVVQRRTHPDSPVFPGGDVYDVFLLGPRGADGKRPKLNFPGAIAYGRDSEEVERRAKAHLARFGLMEVLVERIS